MEGKYSFESIRILICTKENYSYKHCIRACGICGALGTSVGLFLISLACMYPDQYSWLMFIGYPLTLSAGFLNSNCIYSFNWLLPDSQNFISGMYGGTMALSDMLAIVAVWLHDSYELSISSFFFIMSVLCAISSVVYMFFVPDQEYVAQCAQEIMIGLQRSKYGDGTTDGELSQLQEIRTTDPSPSVDDSVFQKISKSFEVLCKMPTISMLVTAFSSAYCLSIMLPTQNMFYYYEAIWPGTMGTHIVINLVNMFAIIYGCGGFFSSILGGKLCDSIGIMNFTIIVALSSLITSICLLVETQWSQIAAQVVITFGSNLYSIVILRYCVLYAPQELFGTISGLIFLFVSILLGVGYVVVFFISDILEVYGVTFGEFQGPFVIVGVVSAALGLLLALYWIRNPPPVFSSIENEQSYCESDDKQIKVTERSYNYFSIQETAGGVDKARLFFSCCRPTAASGKRAAGETVRSVGKDSTSSNKKMSKV